MLEEELLEAKTFRDRVSTVTEKGSRNWVYALKPEGKFYNVRNIFAWLYLAVFFAMPFIKINDMPFFMINVPQGKFIIFGNIFWPQDFFVFAFGMILFIVFIILFTVIYGRLFCGWACPQTIFMEFVFRKIEWLIEGSPTQQKKLNEREWDKDKIIRKTAKHVLFFVFSFLIANMFLAYIVGIDRLFEIIREPISDNIALLFGLLIFTGLFYGVFAFVREIVCTTICPYGRLQGVMFDKDTMQISYDYVRGEPRGKISKKKDDTLSVNKKGDCIDCKKCVWVCPTGIDIRNGVQIDCVGCTACIDACDEVMQKINLPTGLIRYASENEIKEQRKFKANNRIKAYSALLVVLVCIMMYLLFSMKSIDTHIARVKGQLYQRTAEGNISNLFEAKILNKTNKEKVVTFKVLEHNAQIKLIGKNKMILNKESISDITFFMEIPEKELRKRSNNIVVGVYENDMLIQKVKTKFLAPF